MSNALWFGILVGLAVGLFAPEWLKIVVFLVALLLSDLVQTVVHRVHRAHGVSVHGVHSASVHSYHFAVSPLSIGVVGLAFGLWAWHYARKRGLQHLGRAELRARWTAARGISRWGWG
jgi:hypothetical protein